eukprot:7095494-Pyramimonas_sp.AAC.1
MSFEPECRSEQNQPIICTSGGSPELQEHDTQGLLKSDCGFGNDYPYMLVAAGSCCKAQN